MSKYSDEFKLKVVDFAIKYGMRAAAREYNIPSWTTVRQWTRKYQAHGSKGLIKNLKSSYDGNFKQHVVEYMHTNHLSALQTAIHFNLANHNVILRWERIYYQEGPHALYLERRGRSKKMNSKPRKKKLSESVEKDLIAEIQQLRMENAYLKKLNALVQERIERENPKK